MEIYDVVITMESTGASAAIRYAQYCPENTSVKTFCVKLIHLLLFSPDSLRVITVPGTSLTIDKVDVESVLIATST